MEVSAMIVGSLGKKEVWSERFERIKVPPNLRLSGGNRRLD